MNFITEPEHQQILDAETHVLVTGGPGSGKTTTALRKAIKYIEDKKLKDGQRILFLSFSRSAILRVEETMDGVVDKQYHSLISNQTFHSFFWEILKTHGYLLGAPYRLKVIPSHEEETLLLGRQKTIPEWITEKEDLFLSHGKVTFDLFAPKVLEILTKSLAVKKILANKFPIIIVDEAQDTDPKQWGCIKLFAEKCQMLMLADLDQQIHDYRDGINPERIQEIINFLNPLQVSLGVQNHRSNTTEILLFARHVLEGTPRSTAYNGVSSLSYSPRGESNIKHIRQGVGILYKKIKDKTGNDPKNIAILATWGKGVKVVSQALKEGSTRSEIKHRVYFDENATLISSRIIAFLLEPKLFQNENSDLISILDIITSFYKYKGSPTNKIKWEKCFEWISLIRMNKPVRRSSMVVEIKSIMRIIRDADFCGTPEKDWLSVQKLLLNSTCAELVSIIKNTRYLTGFSCGKVISKSLVDNWKTFGKYKNAVKILDSSIIKSQILGEDKGQRGINVMNIHKAKGKEFDGVIIFQSKHSSPFIAREDVHPFKKSKKLLYVAITRAKHNILIIKDPSERCNFFKDFIF